MSKRTNSSNNLNIKIKKTKIDSKRLHLKVNNNKLKISLKPKNSLKRQTFKAGNLTFEEFKSSYI